MKMTTHLKTLKSPGSQQYTVAYIEHWYLLKIDKYAIDIHWFSLLKPQKILFDFAALLRPERMILSSSTQKF